MVEDNVVKFPQKHNPPGQETPQQAAQRRLREKHEILAEQGFAAWLERNFGPERDR